MKTFSVLLFLIVMYGLAHAIEFRVSANVPAEPGNNCYQVEAYDAAGNVSGKSPEICVDVLPGSTYYLSMPKTFPDTLVGARRTKTHTLYNRGTGTMICRKPVFTGASAAEFSTDFNADMRAVSAGGSISFKLIFQPKSLGEKTAVMDLQCGDYSKPSAFLITGKGI